MEATDAKKFIEENLDPDKVKALLVRLVQVPSPQTELLEAEPRVLSFIEDVVKPELEEAGISANIDNMGNLIAYLKGAGKAKRLVLVAYAMNATPSTMPNPYSGEIVDGAPYGINGDCVWGRGACEQKGSLAAMLSALKLIGVMQSELPGDLFFVTSTAGESGKHASLDYVLSNSGILADWGIIDGPPEIQLGNKGRIDVEVTVRGRQAHSSRPWEGVNAVEGAVKVLQKLASLMPHPNDKEHPELGKVSLTPTSIESFPKATHTIPSECRVLLDRRLLPGDEADDAIAQLKATIGDLSPWTVELRPKEYMYPCEVRRDAEVVVALKSAIRTMLGCEAKYSFSTAANDTGLLNVRGIQSVNYGSRDIRFQHTDHDLVSVQSVVDAAKVFAFVALHRDGEG